MGKRVTPRKAGDFKGSIGYDEWVWLTRWRPWMIGILSAAGGLLVGLALGGLGH